jgi:hypothetical protein
VVPTIVRRRYVPYRNSDTGVVLLSRSSPSPIRLLLPGLSFFSFSTKTMDALHLVLVIPVVTIEHTDGNK